MDSKKSWAAFCFYQISELLQLNSCQHFPQSRPLHLQWKHLQVLRLVSSGQTERGLEQQQE
jgi:hypothetical protein